MTIESTPIYGNVEKNNVQLSVIDTGLVVTVGAGDFVIAGNSYTLSEEQIFTATANAADSTLITGYLALENATGAAVLLVDETVLNDSQQPFVFAGSGFSLLHRLFTSTLPPNASELGSVRVYNIIPREETTENMRTREAT